MSDDDYFFRLPTELCCAILSDWLALGSIVRLDSAICSQIKRPILLDTIFTSPQCVLFLGRPYTFSDRVTLKWLCSRKLRVSNFYFDWDVDDIVRQYFQSFGASIRTLEFYLCGITDYLSLVSVHCSRITCLSFAETEYLLLPSDIELLSCKLRALDLHGMLITDSLLEQIVRRCPLLTHFRISDCSALSDNCGTIIGTNLKHLQFLDIANNDSLSDSVLVSIAEHSHTALKVIQMGYTENMVGLGLMALLKKCATLQSVSITYHENNFRNFDFSLLCNLTELSIGHLNETESYLHSIVNHSKRLQRFRVYFNPFHERNSCEFHLSELTVHRLPDLKVLGPFGVPETELQEFRLMRPEVKIVQSHIEFDYTIFCMKW